MDPRMTANDQAPHLPVIRDPQLAERYLANGKEHQGHSEVYGGR